MMMKFRLFFSMAIIIFLSSCNDENNHPKDRKMEAFIDNLMQKMTLDEKIGQLNLVLGGQIITGQATNTDVGRKIKEGKVGALLNVRTANKIGELQKLAVEKTRLGIPLIFGLDVIHGYRTTFPIPLALASSFDMGLIEQSARIAATEATADGICWTFSPMVDICHDPRWGRIAEGPGEDPYLGSRFAKAFVKGYQGDNLSDSHTMMACAKHFALYGAAEAGRDYNTVDMSRLRMFNEYLLPFKATVEAGVGSIMTSFNEVNGIPASANPYLLTGVLRHRWGFKGFTVCDHGAVREMIKHGIGDLQTVSALALNAGLDMDMVSEGFVTTLKKSLKEGKISEEDINRACRPILEAKYKLGLFDDPYRYCDTVRAAKEIFTEEHNRIARETAARTFILLKNDNQLLPLKKKGTIALVGPLADNRWNMAGPWSVATDHSESVTVLEGFKEVVGDKADILYAKGSNIVDDPVMDLRVAPRKIPSIDTLHTPEELRREAVKVAKRSDVVVAIVGEADGMSGEASSRSNIDLPGSQQKLLEALLKTGKPLVMVLFTGRPLDLRWEEKNVPAIINVWFGGTQAGNAIADVLFGDVNPSGKLPVSFPRNIGQIPLFYNHKNTGRPLPVGQWFKKYLSDYLDVPNSPLFPFGYGMSYTNFTYNALELDKDSLKGNQTLTASVRLTNSGNYDGKEVVQLYIRDLVGSITRPVKELKGFQKVFLKAGETKKVSFSITPDDLKFYNSNLDYNWEPGDFVVMVGGNSRDVLADTVYWAR